MTLFTIRHLLKTEVRPDETKDSMVLNYFSGTKDTGVKEEKIYLDYSKPEECEMKIRNALQVKEYANTLIKTSSKTPDIQE